eukprot:2206682-Rhodomonas_salina.2
MSGKAIRCVSTGLRVARDRETLSQYTSQMRSAVLAAPDMTSHLILYGFPVSTLRFLFASVATA